MAWGKRGSLGFDGAHGNMLMAISCQARPERYFSGPLLHLVDAKITGEDLHQHLGTKSFWDHDLLSFEDDVIGNSSSQKFQNLEMLGWQPCHFSGQPWMIVDLRICRSGSVEVASSSCRIFWSFTGKFLTAAWSWTLRSSLRPSVGSAGMYFQDKVSASGMLFSRTCMIFWLYFCNYIVAWLVPLPEASW